MTKHEIGDVALAVATDLDRPQSNEQGMVCREKLANLYELLASEGWIRVIPRPLRVLIEEQLMAVDWLEGTGFLTRACTLHKLLLAVEIDSRMREKVKKHCLSLFYLMRATESPPHSGDGVRDHPAVLPFAG